MEQMSRQVPEPVDFFIHALEDQFQIYRVLRRTDHTEVLVLLHKTLGKRIVQRTFKGDPTVYYQLLGIRHRNLPNVYEVTSYQGKVIVLEEFIDGISMDEALEAGLYTEKAVCTSVRQLCDALDVLHRKVIVHRDIKPENIMISKDGLLKLIDFHTSRLQKPNQHKDTQIIGTVGYAAPEQFGIAATDARADIYALGVLMNVMLTGKHPSNQLYKGRLTDIILKCTALNPDSRFRDVEALQRKLPYR